MIPRIALLVLTFGVHITHAQDWVVNFNNNVVTDPNRYVTVFGTATRLTGTNFMAVLLYGANASSLTANPFPAPFRAPGTASPGTWQGGDRTLTGMGNTPGTVITMRVDLFDINHFANYAAAVAGGGIFGVSSFFTYTIPAPPLAPGATDLQNFRGFDVDPIPEPATVSLAAVGALALWMAERQQRRIKTEFRK
jgi:hypothetical protein